MSQVIKEVLKQKFVKGVKEGINELLSPSYIDLYRDFREFICKQYCSKNQDQGCLENCDKNPAEAFYTILVKPSIENVQSKTLDDICNAVGANKGSVKVFISRVIFGGPIYRDPERYKEKICNKLYKNPEKYGKRIGMEMVSHNPKVVAKATAAYIWLLKNCYT